MEPTIIPGPTATSGPTIPSVGLEVSSLFTGDLSFDGFSLEWLLGMFDAIWSVFTILAYIVSIILLVLYVYASIRKNLYASVQTQDLRDKERLYHEQFGQATKNSRLHDVLVHSESDKPNDWKLAIIEADVILDDTLKQRGFVGSSLGERLKNVSPQQLSTLNDAWEAHKVRNRIAHDGADFVLTQRLAQETIARYRRVFAEFGVN